MHAWIAQLVEHPLGKGKVMDPNSIPGSNLSVLQFCMKDASEQYTPQSPSIGGEINDLFGTLEQIKTGVKHYSLNPDGNPYEGLIPSEMVNRFTSVFPSKGDLEILNNRINDFYDIANRKPEETLPEEYTILHSSVEEKLKQFEESSQK